MKNSGMDSKASAASLVDLFAEGAIRYGEPNSLLDRKGDTR